MKVVICDDSLSDLLRAERFLNEYREEKGYSDIVVEKYSDSSQLYHKIERGETADIYILDVVMTDVSGIDIGRLLKAGKHKCGIIYTTSSRDYALEAYGVHAQRYLVKPYTKGEFGEAFEAVIALYSSREEPVYSVKTQEGIVGMPSSGIVYIECAARTLRVSLADGRLIKSIFLRKSFEAETEVLLEQPKFIQVHKSYIVNMYHIHRLNQETVLMSGGASIPVSKKRTAEVRRRYLEFIALGGGE